MTHDDQDQDSTLALPTGSGPTTRVAGYRILRQIGTGGMGEVFEAWQEHPVRRKVALKFIRPGLASDRVIGRFETERQALAMMQHPNIARVFDAGTSEDGRPYFVMEFITGSPITEYCDEHRLTTRQRLELFIEVCEGIQHAHHKGIIHRDIKPSNVLVQTQDDRPVPKIIDFGVAKATTQSLTERTLMTEVGALVGTPSYMSPEQIDPAGMDIDTRTDIYSLGVLLYELLAGFLPFDSDQLMEGGIVGLCRKIREVDPTRPSARFITMRGSRQQCASKRGVEPSALVRQLRGDLDWIVLKALEKDRARRYETPNALALDVGRHLNDEPVRARAPSASYRVSKFVRRHRVSVAAASLAVVALIAGASTATVGLVRARSAEKAALVAEARATEEASNSQQVSDFLVDLFKGIDPAAARANTATAMEVLDAGAARLREQFADQPETKARLMSTVGRVYLSLGFYDEARSLFEEGLSIRESLVGARHLDVAASLNDLADVYWHTNDYEDARRLHERALAIREASLGPEHVDVAMSLNNLANTVADSGDYEGARPLYERSLAIREKLLGPDHPDVAASLNNLASVFQYLGEFDRAQPLYERALRIDEAALGAEHVFVAVDLDNLGALLQDLHRFDEARPYHERALAIREKLLGADHPQVANTLINLGTLLRRSGDLDGARRSFARARSIYESALGFEHSDVAMSIGNLASLELQTGNLQRSLELYERAGAIYERVLGPEHPTVALNRLNIARVIRASGDLDRARELFRRALPVCEATFGLDSPMLDSGWEGLAEVLHEQGRHEEATRLEKLAAERDFL